MKISYKAIFLFISLSMALVSMANATPVEFTREYTYHAGEADSKLTSRTIVLEQIKRLLLEELGTYLISRTEVKDSQLTKDEIMTYTAGSVATVIINEKWDGSQYSMKAQLKADPDEVARSVLAIRKNEENAIELELLRSQSADTLKEIEQLRTEIELLKKEPPAENRQKRLEKVRRDYEDAVAGLSVRDHIENGLRLRRVGKFQEAVVAFSSAVELKPKLSFPYVLRGQTYLRLRQKARAREDFQQAAKLGDRRAERALHLMKQGRPSRNFQDRKD